MSEATEADVRMRGIVVECFEDVLLLHLEDLGLGFGLREVGVEERDVWEVRFRRVRRGGWERLVDNTRCDVVQAGQCRSGR